MGQEILRWFKRNILPCVYSPVKENDKWRLTYQEIDELLKHDEYTHRISMNTLGKSYKTNRWSAKENSEDRRIKAEIGVILRYYVLEALREECLWRVMLRQQCLRDVGKD